MSLFSRRCRHPSCSTLTREVGGYCTAHKQHRKEQPTERRRVAARFYASEAWRRVRLRMLAMQPYCRMCGKRSQVVDHIVPIRSGGAPLDTRNLQALCKSCHDSKTVRVDGGFGNRVAVTR